jgi:thioredoxin reductase
MIIKEYDVVIIGAGAAGMSAAISISSHGYSSVIIDREEILGGILLQCIHNGFGLHHFGEELTGPEYAERLADSLKKASIDTLLGATVVEIQPRQNKYVLAYSSEGVIQCNCKAIVLAMGCRERNRGSLGIGGTRPAGIFTAGLAQRLINIDGYMPGTKAVIIGSGDIGLIMARRLTLSGCKVEAVVEILPQPSGLTRNIVQCLDDFKIPLFLSHAVNRIFGENRVEGVEVCPLNNGVKNTEKAFHISCDTILLSVGLIPENELTRAAGIEMSQDTGGPVVDANYMTPIPGVFACGNVLHVHDLVDYVSEESARCGDFVAQYLSESEIKEPQYSVKAGSNIKYVNPTKFIATRVNRFYFRPLIVKRNAELILSFGGKIIKTQKLIRVQPSEMIRVEIGPRELSDITDFENRTLEVSVQ